MHTDAVPGCAVDEATLGRPPRKYALHDAAEADDEARVLQLLTATPEQLGDVIDVNEKDLSGCTALHVAILHRAGRAVPALLLHGAGIKTKCNGSPLLHLALAMGGIRANDAFVLQVVKLLLALAVDTAALDDTGRTWLHIAAAHGCLAAAELLWSTPLSSELLGISDKSGRTPLHAAAAAKQGAIVQWLLAKGASVTATDRRGDTPAHCAAYAGWAAGVEMLQSGSGCGSDASVVSNGISAAAVQPRNWAGESAAEVLASVAASTSHSSSSSATAASAPTLLLSHEVCREHHTCDPITRQMPAVPPENTRRLDALLSPIYGSLRAAEYEGLEVKMGAPRALISDVLRVHDYEYVRKLLSTVGQASALPPPSSSSSSSAAAAAAASTPISAPLDSDFVKHLDGDTAVSASSWEAALRAAGAVCAAVDRVVSGRNANAFCPVRPPGHHAGPSGIVLNEHDAVGTHGFCLLNNVAVGAAYARNVYGRQRSSYANAMEGADGGGADAASAPAASPSIRRIAIFDFDVHHGNGTEAIVRQLAPVEVVSRVSLPFGAGAFSVMSYRPWLEAGDGSDVLFVSSHGYGLRDPARPEGGDNGWFFPGSGRPCGWEGEAFSSTEAIRRRGAAGVAEAAADAMAVDGGSDESGGATGAGLNTGTAAASDSGPHSASAFSGVLDPQGAVSAISLQATPVPEPLLEASARHPCIINVGLKASTGPRAWRRIMTADILPRIAAFKPDIIFISAGFDAHHKDAINWGYLGLREEDYDWITRQLMKVANTCCGGRIVSVLEGGYRIQGLAVSAFSRSVAAHVRALSSGSRELWDTKREHAKLQAELAAEAAATEAAAAAAAAAAASATVLAPLGSPSSGVAPLRRPQRAAAAGGVGTATLMAASPLGSPSPEVSSARSTFALGAAANASSFAAAADGAVHNGTSANGATTAAEGSSSESGAAAASASRAANPAPTPSSPSSSARLGAGKRRRSAAPVDYAALDAQMRAEAGEERAKRRAALESEIQAQQLAAVAVGAMPQADGGSSEATDSGTG